MTTAPQTDGRLGTTVLGNYRLSRKLGEGGMGAVYQADHVELGTKLAVKVLHAECAARPEIVRRFQAEAWAASRLNHPNIVSVIDIGRLETGEPYIALEYLDGYPLDQLPLPLVPEQILLIVVPVCQALAVAHMRGIIHRDLKPANIFIQVQGEIKTVKLVDFGIAKLLTESLLAGAERTHAQAVMGTPAYMSPEQARSSAACTAASDIYSLGAMLFELCTGRRPYNASSIGDIVTQQLTQPVPDPGLAAPRSATGLAADHSRVPRRQSAGTSGQRSRPGRATGDDLPRWGRGGALDGLRADGAGRASRHRPGHPADAWRSGRHDAVARDGPDGAGYGPDRL